ncbi:helix-turn-helix transcriptional regulator [Jannaschia aquimarina]|uniref:Bacterial regulatory protein, luxR family n=1 Tax=Jannaschia aquimarina TaxID=935700 RepID=A0A0D1EFZ7_9RHOB|nr:helix-turn-helix transcriptional regulator [Jannaschia aquimarina]KIT14770.1 Bacterial regulatory protein, luxR family [Jannaschia aquimarina]SNT42474.1 DNA-binding transcriptional regulator, CsgD family [Jannaschia aquimarina]
MRHDPNMAELLWRLSDGESVLEEAVQAISDDIDGATLAVGSLDPVLDGAGVRAVAELDGHVGGRLWGDLSTPSRNPALRFLSNSEPGRLLHYRPWMSWDTLRRSDLYEQVLEPGRIGMESAGMRLPVPGYGDLQVYCGLRRERPWLDRATLVRTESSLRALGRAVGHGLRRRGVRRTGATACTHALDATFVIGADGQMLSRTGAADNLIAEGVLLRMREGITHWVDARAAEAVRPLIAAALCGDERRGVFPRGRRMLLVRTFPGPSSDRRPTVVLAAGWARPPQWSSHDLRVAYDLTPREAQVVLGVIAGRTPDQIASGAGLKAASVRMYLKRVYAKTETRGQVNLLAMLAGTREVDGS